MGTVQSNTKLPRILVHLHLYYQDQWPYFQEKLSHITACTWDLCVTLTKSNKILEEQICQFKPNVQIKMVTNRGYDIWPFLQVIYSTDLSQYDYVLKLHTKHISSITNIQPHQQEKIIWRDSLVDALLSSPSQFTSNLKRMHKSGGLCAAGSCFLRRTNILLEDTSLYDNLQNTLGCHHSSRWFVAGTMFLIRASCLKKLQNHPFPEHEFIATYHSGSDGTLAHAIERIFIPLVLEQKWKVYLINLPKLPPLAYFNCYRYFVLSYITQGQRKKNYIFKHIFLQSAILRNKGNGILPLEN